MKKKYATMLTHIKCWGNKIDTWLNNKSAEQLRSIGVILLLCLMVIDLVLLAVFCSYPSDALFAVVGFLGLITILVWVIIVGTMDT